MTREFIYLFIRKKLLPFAAMLLCGLLSESIFDRLPVYKDNTAREAREKIGTVIIIFGELFLPLSRTPLICSSFFHIGLRTGLIFLRGQMSFV